MLELTRDTNDVDPAIVKAELEKIEAEHLAKKKVEAEKAIKGSQKQKAAKAIVAKIEKAKKERANIPVEVKVDETTVPLPGTPTSVQVTPELIEDERVTIGSADNTKGVEQATTLRPEDILQNQETIEANPEVLEEAVDTSDEGVVLRAAESTKDPLLIAMMKEDTTTLSYILGEIKPADRQVLVAESLRKLGRGAIEYGAIIGPKMKKALEVASTRKQKDVEGSKTTDAIRWDINELGSEEVVQKGKHKETGEEVQIMNALKVFEPGEVKEGTTTDVDDISDMWEVYVSGKLKETVKGKVKARQAAEKHVKALSEEFKKKEAEAKSAKGKKAVKVSDATKQAVKDYNTKNQKDPSLTKKKDETKAEGGKVTNLNKDEWLWDPTLGKLVPRPKEDQADTKVRKAKDKKLRNPLEIIQEQAKETPEKLARNLFERTKGDRLEASRLALYIKDEVQREEVLEKLEDLRYRVVDEIYFYLIFYLLNRITESSVNL
jgi:hypothetical protein